MKRGRNLGLAVVLSSGLGIAMLVAAPTAFAATGPAGSVAQSAALQHTAFTDDPPRGDYARGYDDGRQQGVTDGTHDADVDCTQHKRMTARDSGEYQRGWEDGYDKGYEFGYTRTYNQKCKSGGGDKAGSGHK